MKGTAEVMVYEMLLILFCVISNLMDAESGDHESLFVCLFVYLSIHGTY